MLTGLFDDNSPEWKKRIEDLGSSDDPEDRIVAVLMDVKIGSFGLQEDLARVKAKTIVQLFDLIV